MPICANPDCKKSFEANKNNTKKTCSIKCNKAVYYLNNKLIILNKNANYYNKFKTIILKKRKIKLIY